MRRPPATSSAALSPDSPHRRWSPARRRRPQPSATTITRLRPISAAPWVETPPVGRGPLRARKCSNTQSLRHSSQGPCGLPDRLQNTFANESFMDEVAAAVTADPVQYRLRHLSDPRLIAVLNAAAKAANWDTRPSPKPGNPKTGVVTGRGVSCVLYEGNNGYSAMVAEVSVDQDTGNITVMRLVASQDSGPVSNPGWPTESDGRRRTAGLEPRPS